MATTTPNAVAPLPMISAGMMRALGAYVTAVNGVAVGVSALVIAFLNRPEWWPAFYAAAAVAAVCTIASVGVLSLAAGRTIDWLPTFVMGTSVARIGVSVAGLMVAVKVFQTPPDATAFMICSFYALTLFIESAQLFRVTSRLPAAAVGGSNA